MKERVHTGCADPPSGERGIRTLDTRFHVCRFSKPVPSASRPSLQESPASYWRRNGSTTLAAGFGEPRRSASKNESRELEADYAFPSTEILLAKSLTSMHQFGNASPEVYMLHRQNGRVITFFAVLGCIAAAASPLAVVEYEIPRERAFPHDPAVGSDGIVWYTDQRNSFIGRLNPTTGKITDYATPTPASGPHGIVVAPDGAVWYTAQRTGKLGRLDPKTGTIEEYSLPAGARDPHTLLIRKGIVWFTVQQSNMYGRLDPRTREAKVWTVPTSEASPYGIVNAPDASIWVALFGTNKLGRVDAASGALEEITLPERRSRPRRLAVDETGVVWYSDYARGYLGSYNPKTRAFKEWLSSGGERSAPYGIAIAPDGRVFYQEARSGNIIAFDRKTEKMETVKIPTDGSIVRNMSVDSTRNRLWLALSGTGRIGKIELK
jgi:virginiamycin B lyase